MSYFAIDSEHGQELCSGLREHEADKAAQNWANRLGESVYLYEVGSPGEPVEFVPAPKDGAS